jgi:3-oxoacyl-[acyl-carrier-protein] synthase II
VSPRARRRVAVTGIGVVSPFGGDAEDFVARLRAGESAVALLERDEKPRPIALPAVRCAGFDADAQLGRGLAHTMDRFSQLGTAAALAAWQDAGLPKAGAAPRNDWGVSWSTALGGILTFEAGYRDLFQNGRERVSPLSVVLGMNNAAAAHIAIELGLGDACHTFSVACASSAIALGEGLQRIRSGQSTVVLAGGSDAGTLAYSVIRAWEALRVLAPATRETAPAACKPFHVERAGLVLGEGAGALVLEDWEHATARGARIHAELAGFGTTCDHSHLVRPEAGGQIRAMQAALADGDLQPGEIGYVNAHGTATREGDPTEIEAIRAVFGERATELPVSATKSMHGHMLGATGVLEAIITILALRDRLLPPTAHLDEATLDPACRGVRHITGKALASPGITAAISNSFAFGGSNAVLAFRRAD